MKRILQISAALLSASAFGQVAVNGTIAGDAYCSTTIQTVETQFGDNTSELDAGYGSIINGRLYLALTGNLENNFNKLEIFIDSVAGGENLLTGVPGNDGSNVMAGMRFDAGFEADYHVIVRRGNDGTTDRLDVDFAQLGTPNFSFYGNVFGGTNTGVGVTGTGFNTSPIQVAYDNSNTLGVLGGCNAADPVAATAVTTGLELSIALADLGLPAGPVRVCAFVNGSGHNYASNQFLGGLAAPQCNLGGDGAGVFTGSLSFDLGAFAGDQFFTVTPCTVGTPIFGVDVRLQRFFTSDTRGFVTNFRPLGPFTTASFALDFSADATTLWAIQGVNRGVIDLTTGVFTVLGTITGPLNAAGLTAAVDGTTWYIVENQPATPGPAQAVLWVGDITTGIFTQVGVIGPQLFIDISIDATNRLFGMEIATDSLFSIDTATGAGTLIGPTGFATNFAQGMDFDWTTNILYATLYTGGGTGTFASLDLTTGAGTALATTTPLNAEMEMAVRVPVSIPNFNVCIGTTNSTGLAARLQVAGSGLVANDNVLLTVHNLPQASTGYFLNSPDAPFTVLTPGGAQGDLCIASFSQGRHAANILDSGTSGAVQLLLDDLTQIPQPNGPTAILAGTAWSWQYWYRDVVPVIGATSNFSNARRVLFF
jgi:hypothetical protein